MAAVNHSETIATSDLQGDRGWLRWLPKRLLPFALLSRWDRPIGVWLMLLPALWGLCLAAPTVPDGRLLVLFFIGGCVMRGAGCTINDILDRRLDAAVTRTATRPLAGGAIGARAAWLWLALQSLIGFAVLLQLPPAAQLYGWLAVPLIFLYPLMKRITWWPQAWLGLTFNWGLWIGAAVYATPTQPVWFWLYAGCICWTLGYDTIYAVQDRDDDAKIGVRSTARLWGAYAPRFVAVMYAAALLLWAIAGLYLPWAYFVGWALAALICLWLVARWQPGVLLSAREAFVRNRYVGLAMLLAVLLTKL